jgi:ABC-type proline/glycine betaine transport system ATPase subunit
MTYPDIAAGARLVQGGRADLMLTDFALTDSLVKENPTLYSRGWHRSARSRQQQCPEIVWRSGGPLGIELTVNRGEVVAVLGPSGSGKSTFLRLISHLESVDWGEIVLDGRHVGYERRGEALKPVSGLAKARADARIGMVFQHFDMFNHLTAIENVIEAPIRVLGITRSEAKVLGVRLLAGRRPAGPCR